MANPTDVLNQLQAKLFSKGMVKSIEVRGPDDLEEDIGNSPHATTGSGFGSSMSNRYSGDHGDTDVEDAEDVDTPYVTNRPITFTTPIELNNQNANILSKIYTLGYPANNERYSIGKILLKIGDSFYSNASVISGCSGSGVINDKGQLIGILWGGNQIDTMSAYIEISHILKFLNQINVIPWK